MADQEKEIPERQEKNLPGELEEGERRISCDQGRQADGLKEQDDTQKPIQSEGDDKNPDSSGGGQQALGEDEGLENSDQGNGNKNGRKRLIWILVAVAAAAIAVIAIVQVVSAQLAQQKSLNAYRQIAAVTPSETDAPSGMPIASDGKRPSDRDIDFGELQKTNEDIIAWISIPGTDIDYPVVKTDDNEYYLDHDAFRQESKEGAIFIDMGNDTGFSDPNTVIYGHNMKNGSMFAGLHQYGDEAFLKENNLVKIYVPDGMYQYQIFAARPIGDGNILYENDFSKKEAFQKYLDGILNTEEKGAVISGSEMPDTDSKLITLSTCIQDEPEKRFVVDAVLQLS